MSTGIIILILAGFGLSIFVGCMAGIGYEQGKAYNEEMSQNQEKKYFTSVRGNIY